MTRKKSRKIGQIGIPKATTPRVAKTEDRTRTKKGNKSGTRQQLTEINPALNSQKQKNQKLGSKKAIDLSKYKLGKQEQASHKQTKQESIQLSYKTPQEELDAIENDKELEALLEKQEDGILSSSERAYVEEKTDRYQVLCELMGIDTNEYDDTAQETNEKVDDPFAKLDAIKLDDYKD